MGKAIDSGKLPSYLIDVGLAILGIQVFGDWSGALYGPIAFRLALAPGGTPPISQIAGIAGLASLGLAYSHGIDVLTKSITGGETTKGLGAEPHPDPSEVGPPPNIMAFDPGIGGCPKGYHPMLTLKGWVCKKD